MALLLLLQRTKENAARTGRGARGDPRVGVPTSTAVLAVLNFLVVHLRRGSPSEVHGGDPVPRLAQLLPPLTLLLIE